MKRALSALAAAGLALTLLAGCGGNGDEPNADATTPAVDVNGGGEDTDGAWPAAIRDPFIQECSSDPAMNVAMCECIVDEFENNMSLAEFTQMSLDMAAGDESALGSVMEATLACIAHMG